MRIHVTKFGKVTTVSVDEILAAYVLAKIGNEEIENYGFESQRAKRQLTAWIQEKLDNPTCDAPEKGLSQWVRRRMLIEVIDTKVRARYFRCKDAFIRMKGTGQQARKRVESSK